MTTESAINAKMRKSKILVGMAGERVRLLFGNSIPEGGLAESLPGGCGGAYKTRIRTGLCAHEGQIPVAVPPDVTPCCLHKLFEIDSLTCSQSTTQNHHGRIEHVDQPTNAPTQRFGSGEENRECFFVSRLRSRDDFLCGLRFDWRQAVVVSKY